MKIIGISGSAPGGSSTDILIKAVLEGALSITSGGDIKTVFYRLNEKKIMPCQACGKSPEPEFCFFHDDMDELYNAMQKADGIIFGSPIYFDSVSAQAKLFIDRTNCLRPADFSDPSGQTFKPPRLKGKKGGIILVAGEREKFDSAFRTARGFYIWAGIDIVFELTFRTKSLAAGEAKNDNDKLMEAAECGKKLVEAIMEK